jgi:hypothetical protein
MSVASPDIQIFEHLEIIVGVMEFFFLLPNGYTVGEE